MTDRRRGGDIGLMAGSKAKQEMSSGLADWFRERSKY